MTEGYNPRSGSLTSDTMHPDMKDWISGKGVGSRFLSRLGGKADRGDKGDDCYEREKDC